MQRCRALNTFIKFCEPYYILIHFRNDKLSTMKHNRKLTMYDRKRHNAFFCMTFQQIRVD